MELNRQQDRCAIRLNDALKSELLDIPYPCGFVRSSERLVAQIYYYQGVGQVFKEAYTENSGVRPKHMCPNRGQAINLNTYL